MLIYHHLTKRFNADRLRAVLCSGQAVVMHRLAITSKDGEDALATALDHERRQLMKADEARLARYKATSESWEATWPTLSSGISSLPLTAAHTHLVAAAQTHLPQQP